MIRPVLLRNGKLAEVQLFPVGKAIGFGLIGRTHAGQELELWSTEGHWRENKTEHPLDIVRGLFTPLTPADLEKRSP